MWPISLNNILKMKAERENGVLKAIPFGFFLKLPHIQHL
jgi:hypothetical protein